MDITLDIHGKARGLGDSETEVKSDDTRDTTKTDEQTPHGVDVSKDGRVIGQQGALVSGNDNNGNNGSS